MGRKIDEQGEADFADESEKKGKKIFRVVALEKGQQWNERTVK